MSKVRTRIAPSPTGYPHIGTIYQALFDYVFAKKTDGKFIVRIEDTDRTRFVEGAEEVVFSSLDWFGLKSDENPIVGGEYGPYRSSERLEIYKKYALELIQKGDAYYCFCTKERLDEMRKKQEAEKKAPMYDKHCRNLSKEEIDKNLEENLSFVIRMKIPENEKIKFKDTLLGEVEFDSNLIDDQVIVKSDGFPTYHLASVVDDYLMKISHVFRGQEWLPSAPKHLLLYQYLGWKNEMPQFIHLPVILNSEGGGKLSKRQGHASVDFYKTEGFLPEAILNYLANIVWNNPTGEEIYPFEELANALHIDSENKITEIEIYSQGPKFDLQKLTWMNGEYIRKMSDEELGKRLVEYLKDYKDKDGESVYKDKILKLIPLVKERIKVLSDFIPLTIFMFEEGDYDIKTFSRINIDDQKLVLEKILEKLKNMERPWNAEIFEKTFRDLADELEIPVREMFQLLRVGITGQLVTPPLFECIEIMGEDWAIKRVEKAISFVTDPVLYP